MDTGTRPWTSLDRYDLPVAQTVWYKITTCVHSGDRPGELCHGTADMYTVVQRCEALPMMAPTPAPIAVQPIAAATA
jgi:hypothetical protein